MKADPLREARAAGDGRPAPPKRTPVADGVPRRIVHVVHGWPPWDRAGTEIYARGLAVRQAGDREVGVYARIADPGRGAGEATELVDDGARVRLVVNNFTQRDPLSRNALARRAAREGLRALPGRAARPSWCTCTTWRATPPASWASCARRADPVRLPAAGLVGALRAHEPAGRVAARCAPGPRPRRCARCLPLTGIAPAALLDEPSLYRRRASVLRARAPGAAAVVMGSRFIRRLVTARSAGSAGRAPGDPLRRRAAASRRRRARRAGAVRSASRCIGSVMPHKGVHVAVAAFRDDRAGRGHARRLGRRPPSCPTTRASCGPLASPAVRFRGAFEESGARTCSRRMDVLIAPSLGLESFGLVVAEAQARGVPVVASRRGALVEARDGRRATARSSTPGDRGRAWRALVARLARGPEIVTRWRPRAAGGRRRWTRTRSRSTRCTPRVRVRSLRRRRPCRAHGAARPAREGSARGGRSRPRPAGRVARARRRALGRAGRAGPRARAERARRCRGRRGWEACRCSCATGCGIESRQRPSVLLSPDGARLAPRAPGRRRAARARVAGARIDGARAGGPRRSRTRSRGPRRDGRASAPLRGRGGRAASQRGPRIRGRRAAGRDRPRLHALLPASAPLGGDRRPASAPSRRDEDRCHACLRARLRGAARASKAPGARRWPALLARGGRARLPVGVPARRLARAAAGLDAARQHVIEPGRRAGAGRTRVPRAASCVTSRSWAPPPRRRARSLVPGIARAVADGRSAVSALGGGDVGSCARLARAARHRGPRLLARGHAAGDAPGVARVDVALLLSLVPESYGLTLDECWRAGVPVVAFDHGAMAGASAASAAGCSCPLAEGAVGVAPRSLARPR